MSLWRTLSLVNFHSCKEIKMLTQVKSTLIFCPEFCKSFLHYSVCPNIIIISHKIVRFVIHCLYTLPLVYVYLGRLYRWFWYSVLRTIVVDNAMISTFFCLGNFIVTKKTFKKQSKRKDYIGRKWGTWDSNLSSISD